MDLVLLFSILVSIFSLALTLIGIPAQIAKNYKEKRSGQPLLTIIIALGFYASQIGLFVVTQNWLPFVSFAIGFAMWGIALGQYILYGNRQK